MSVRGDLPPPWGCWRPPHIYVAMALAYGGPPRSIIYGCRRAAVGVPPLCVSFLRLALRRLPASSGSALVAPTLSAVLVRARLPVRRFASVALWAPLSRPALSWARPPRVRLPAARPVLRVCSRRPGRLTPPRCFRGLFAPLPRACSSSSVVVRGSTARPPVASLPSLSGRGVASLFWPRLRASRAALASLAPLWRASRARFLENRK